MRRSLVAPIAIAAALCSGCATGITGQPIAADGHSAAVEGAIRTTTGGPVEWWVEYGPTTAYGSETPHTLGDFARRETRSVREGLFALELATTYHYRFCARDSEQGSKPGCGEDRSVTTQSVDCGGTVTQDLKLTAPMDCRAASTTDGFTIGADGVEINLAGYAFTGFSARTGIVNDGYDDVTIRNGSMPEWRTTIAISNASRNSIRRIDGRCLAIESGQDNVVRRNVLHDCLGDGIFVAAAASGTLLRANTASGNGDDGIDTRSSTSRLRRNEANDNGDFGIDAAPGVTDLGGNSASGNGNPLQCSNVFCG